MYIPFKRSSSMKTVSSTSVPISLPITTIPVGSTCPGGTFCMRKDFCNQFGGTCITESCSCYPTITTTTTTISYPTVIPLQATEEIITPCDLSNPANNCCCKLPSTWTPTTSPTITTQTTTTATPPTTALAGAPPTKAEAYVALGIALLIAVGGIGYLLYSRRKK